MQNAHLSRVSTPRSLSLCLPLTDRPEESTPLKGTSRVRVTYYESKRPLSVSGSSSDGSELGDRTAGRAAATATRAEMPNTYIVSR